MLRRLTSLRKVPVTLKDGIKMTALIVLHYILFPHLLA